MAKSKSRTIRLKDGTVMHTWEGKLHSWDGPALIPQNDPKQGEYYVYGIQYSKERWDEAKKEQSGLPWYKSSSGKIESTRH